MFFQLINSQNGIILRRKIVESVTTYSTLLLTVKIVAFTRVNLELFVVKFMLVEIFLEPPIPIVQQTWNGLSGKVTHPATVIINSLLPAEREYWSHTLASQPSLLESVHFNHLGGGPMVKTWDQEVCFLCGLRFEPCSCSYDGHWRLTWSLTSGPVGLVEVRASWPGHPR